MCAKVEDRWADAEEVPRNTKESCYRIWLIWPLLSLRCGTAGGAGQTRESFRVIDLASLDTAHAYLWSKLV